jgi:hypothetical protein
MGRHDFDPKRTSEGAYRSSEGARPPYIGPHARSCGRGHRIGERRPLLTQSGRHPREGPFRIAGLRAAVVNWRDEASRIGLYQARPWLAC